MPRKYRKGSRVEEQKKVKVNPSYANFIYGCVVVVALFALALLFFRVFSQREVQREVGKISKEAIKTEKLGEVKEKDGQYTYTVQEGDNLWTISDRFYKSGYNWTDIAKTNNLSQPNIIYAGTKLVIPRVAQKVQSEATQSEHNISSSNEEKIDDETYVVKQGDNLWMIAEKAYGDGFRWVDIAKENHLANPGIIHAGNVLKIPG